MELAFTGSLGPFQVALRDSGGALHTCAVANGRADLAVLVARACAEAGARPGDIDSVRFDLGPGSYTGLRVAATFANTCRALGGAKVFTVTTIELVAAAATRAPDARTPSNDPRAIAVVFDARRGRWHCGHVTVTADRIAGRGRPEALQIGAALATLVPERCDELLVDAAVEQALATGVGADGAELAPGPHPPRRGIPELTAADLFDCRLEWRAADRDVQPLYLMGSYAEEP